MHNFFKLFLITFFVFSAQNINAQEVPLKIAVVDMEKVLGVASAPKSIRKQITKIRADLGKAIKSEEAGLRDANQKLAQKQTLLSAEAFKEERRKFEQQVRNVQQSVQTQNISLQKAQQTAMQEVRKALSKVVLTLSQANGYTLILRREQTVVVADPLDITDQVITELNKTLPNVTVSVK